MNIYTLPAWRERGIVSRLMEVFVEEMRRGAAGGVWLHANTLGRPLYERYGFIPINLGLAPAATIELERKV